MSQSIDAPRTNSTRSLAMPVTTGAQAGARDRAAIAAGTSSFDLMLRAGTSAASLILRQFADRLHEGVALFAGPGNNGGDAYVVAAQLARAGVRVRLHASSPPRTDDAKRAAAIAEPILVHGAISGSERLCVDGLLGTGHNGVLRDDIAASCARIALMRDGRAVVVALDLPSGLDAASGDVARGTVPANVTVTFGTLKRGLLLQRALCGEIAVADIGLGGHAHLDDGAWSCADTAILSQALQPVAWDVWKTRRGVVVLAGGATGMAGATILAARAALGSGAGLVHVCAAGTSTPALQAAVPQALAHESGDLAGTLDSVRPHSVAVGPGLGRSAQAREIVKIALQAAYPLVLDADALTMLAAVAQESGRHAADVLADAAQDRAIVLTPHPAEFARLSGVEPGVPFEARANAVQSFAIRSRTTVLCKGTPTIICDASGAPPILVARGTPVLATGGSGDLLTGIVATLLAQQVSPIMSAAVAAWVHGRSAELVGNQVGTTRGISLDAVLDLLPRAWHELEQPEKLPMYLSLVLPSVNPDTRPR